MSGAALAGALVVAVLALGAAPAVAEVGDGTIPRMAVTVDVRDDGTLAVTEEITYAFTTTGHGIERWIPLEYPYDRHHVRVITIDDVTVTSPTGAPTELRSRTSRAEVSLRIGDPAVLVSGEQTYLLRYTVAGALTHAADAEQLAWNAVGTAWRVPIAEAWVEVTAPAITSVRCLTGTPESPRSLAPSEQSDGRVACATVATLRPGSGLSAVVDLPRGAVEVPEPQLRRSGALGWLALPATLTALGVLVAGLIGTALLLWQHGRDRRFAGEIPGLEPPAGADRREELLPWGEERNVPVAFTPPEGLRPGEVGTLLDERANALDVTATILDLAQRGFLQIGDASEPTGPWSRWAARSQVLLTDRSRHPPRHALREYERQLLDAFRAVSRPLDGGQGVVLSQLGTAFGSRLPAVQRALYADVVERGWYRRAPDKTRGDWTVVAVVGAAAAAASTVGLLVLGGWWQVGLAATAVCLALLWGARRMPARTGSGTAARVQALGFRKYLATAEADQIRFEEEAAVFSRALPWAVVFGVTEHWSHVLAEVGDRFPAVLDGLTPFDVVRLLDDVPLDELVRALDTFAVRTSHAVGHSASLSGVDAFEVGGAVLKVLGGLVVGGLGGGGGGGW